MSSVISKFMPACLARLSASHFPSPSGSSLDLLSQYLLADGTIVPRWSRSSTSPSSTSLTRASPATEWMKALLVPLARPVIPLNSVLIALSAFVTSFPPCPPCTASRSG
eukprot:CAMPEP_0181349100 /NCGR_PEP_ID=MMETSP1106-20121128/542_1 /TAXON_ID=81844 /ORGANISM="Mantoniella antarctica, Strain SL-175" /LENGTH=108 /DNA_ID=CAMNT_0023461463 /DNA_START=26 /DNA_END=352 /DNA_ORIENTATION=+